MAGLGPLTEFDLDHAHLRRCSFGRKLHRIKLAIRCAAAKIGRGHLPDNVAAAGQVVRRERPLAGVVRKAAQTRTRIESLDCRRRQRAKRGARDVEHRHGIGRRPLAHRDTKVRICNRCGSDGVVEPVELVRIHVGQRTKRPHRDLLFGALVDHGALIARIRHLFVVGLEKILAQLGPQALEEITQIAEQRIVGQHRMLLLPQVV